MPSNLSYSLICLVSLVLPACATAEPQRVYRCGNTYTNQPEPNASCKTLSGGSVTVIEGTRIQATQALSASMVASGVKVDNTEQRQRDAQAQVVLQAELQRVQQQQAELLRDWQNGAPERRADEHRQPQKYQQRVADMRSAIQRGEADIAGLQREISRLSVSSSLAVKP